jgi:Domain of unknown function (DUF1841)
VRYNPEIAPDPDEWLASTEADRIDAVRRGHQTARHQAGSPQLHAAIHVTVENQLAEGHRDATEAMNRLLAGGLRRHEALHAIGSVVAAEMFEILKSKRTHDAEIYSRKLQQLTAAAWRAAEDE